MLYVIYGLTSTVGKESRAYFKARGIDLIEKLTYVTKDVRVKAGYGIPRQATTEEEVRRCDYVYENHGRLVGITLDQIFSALNGTGDSLLTFSAEGTDLLRQIKIAYPDRVVSIYAYIDAHELEALTNELPHEVTAEERRARLGMGQAIKESFLENRALFDETVLYCGENSPFNLESLRLQYARIIEKYETLDDDLVPLPYSGDKPYVFVSYARKDTERILPYLNFLRVNGCRIWYDKGIAGGENWPNILADKVAKCSQYIVFASKFSTASKWTRREILAADRYDKEILTIRMDHSSFEAGIELFLSEYQQLFTDHKDFDARLIESIKPEVRRQTLE